MPKASTVWMINARTGRMGWKGELTLTERRLVFEPTSKNNGEVAIELADVRRVRRVMGTPVLEVKLSTPNRLALEIVGFYFTKPPSLDDPEDVRFFKRRVARRRSLIALRQANVGKKQDIADWVEAINRAKTEGRAG